MLFFLSFPSFCSLSIILYLKLSLWARSLCWFPMSTRFYQKQSLIFKFFSSAVKNMKNIHSSLTNQIDYIFVYWWQCIIYAYNSENIWLYKWYMNKFLTWISLQLGNLIYVNNVVFLNMHYTFFIRPRIFLAESQCSYCFSKF